MSTLVFANNASATLAGAITNTSTTINLQSGEGALFPVLTAGEYFVGTFVDAATGLLNEIVWCTARSGDVLTIARAQEGTTGLSWNAGDFFSELWTAGQSAAMLQQSQVPNSSNYFGTDAGTVNAIVSTVTPALTSLTNGQSFEIQTAYANTSATVVMNLSTLGNYNCYRSDGTALQVGDIQGPPYAAQFVWNSAGTKFLLQNPVLWKSKLPPQVTVYANHGSGTYTTPVGASYISVEMVGAGGGGGGSGDSTSATVGSAGTASTFGASLTANGGPGATTQGALPTAAATATGGDDNISGAQGSTAPKYNGAVPNSTASSGYGAPSFFGGGGPMQTLGSTSTPNAVVPGSGGSGAATSSSSVGYYGSGGGAGAFLRKLITSPAATYAYVVGQGGAGGVIGTNGVAGGAGADGYIKVTAYFN